MFLSFFSNVNYCQQKYQTPDFEKLNQSVFAIKIYDSDHQYLGYGSGFIIDSNGTCITNFHVLKNSYYAIIHFKNGIEYDLDKITGYNETIDIARFTLKKHSDEKFLPVKLSFTLPKLGSKVWAMGTPADTQYMNTLSTGIISNISNTPDRILLQTSAPIAHGNSGGALINSKGEVIGITTSGIIDKDDPNVIRAQINFAVFIKEINRLPLINIPRVANKIEKSGTVCFYADNNSSNTIALYIDNIYVGSISKHFEFKPSCGAFGTLTNSLKTGFHKWHGIENETNSIWSGSLFVISDNCQIVKINANDEPQINKNQEPKIQAYEYPKFALPENSAQNNDSKDRLYEMISWTRLILDIFYGSGEIFFSPIERKYGLSNRSILFGSDFTNNFYLQKYFKRGRYLQFSFANGNGLNSIGIDFIRMNGLRNSRLDFKIGVGPAIKYFWNAKSGQSKIENSYIQMKWASEIVFHDRIVLHGDIAAGLAINNAKNIGIQNIGLSSQRFPTNQNEPSNLLSGNLFIGYKFGLKHTELDNIFLSKPIKYVSKFTPYILVPGYLDFKIPKNGKITHSAKTLGTLKLITFLVSASMSIGCKVYSDAEYKNYLNSNQPGKEMSIYSRANSANKLYLTSGIIAGSLFTYNFCESLSNFNKVHKRIK